MTMTMPAVVLTADGRIALQDRRTPTLRPDQVLVEVDLCGICGSDLHASQLPQVYRGDCVLGHRVHRPGSGGWRRRRRVGGRPEGRGQPQRQRGRHMQLLPVRAAELLSARHFGDCLGSAGRWSAGTADGRLPRAPAPDPRQSGNSRGGLGRTHGYRTAGSGARRRARGADGVGDPRGSNRAARLQARLTSEPPHRSS